jgi:hypothetical protein
MKSALPISFWLTLALCGSAFAQAAPATRAAMISSYRLKHGEGQVTMDSTLNQIAHAQAAAMASSDVMDHGVLGPFSSRVASFRHERAGENIAYGHDGFSKTLGRWIDSPDHRQNLLMHGASKVGVASARSAKSGQTYWAMVIAVTLPPAKRGAVRHTEKACRLSVLDECLVRESGKPTGVNRISHEPGIEGPN